jgi:multidrug efflux pump subunit AcrA (membrane-fusion protein)
MPAARSAIGAFQKHWFISLLLLCAGVAGATWTVQNTTLVRIIERDLESTKTQLASVTAALSTAKEELKELRANNETLTAKGRELGHQLAEMRDKVTEAIGSENLRSALQAADAERLQLKEALTESERRLKALLAQKEAELTEARERAKGAESRLAELASTAERLRASSTELQAKVSLNGQAAGTNLHAYEGSTSVPGSVSDSLTGATMGLSSVWPVSKRADVIVTFPDGKTEHFSSALVGTGWKYEWRKRRFVVTFASIDSRDLARVTFRETTEP